MKEGKAFFSHQEREKKRSGSSRNEQKEKTPIAAKKWGRSLPFKSGALSGRELIEWGFLEKRNLLQGQEVPEKERERS